MVGFNDNVGVGTGKAFIIGVVVGLNDIVEVGPGDANIVEAGTGAAEIVEVGVGATIFGSSFLVFISSFLELFNIA